MRLSIENRDEQQTVERALHKMNNLALISHRLSKSMAMNALEEALLWCAKHVLRKSEHDSRIEQAEEYLCQHLRDHVTLDDLADAVGLSVSRLSHLFKQQTGVTPQRYYEVQRLERARQLLELTSLPIKSIATEVGFESPFYFTLRFKRYAGKSPRKYRGDAQPD
jgi:AraC family transcriptional regulator, arabinose operon regulatory protein